MERCFFIWSSYHLYEASELKNKFANQPPWAVSLNNLDFFCCCLPRDVCTEMKINGKCQGKKKYVPEFANLVVDALYTVLITLRMGFGLVY